jgi:hypothetical protein
MGEIALVNIGLFPRLDMDLDEAFNQTVIIPWNTAARNVEDPWNAPASVLESWSKGLYSKSPLDRFVSAVGVFRCANGDDYRFEATRAIAESVSEVPISTATLIDLLLCGARPPEDFLLALFTAEMPHPSDRLLGQYVRFLRHPGVFVPDYPLPCPLDFFSSLNPRAADAHPLGNYGKWGDAVLAFKDPSSSAEPEGLSLVGRALSCDQSATDVRRTLADSSFPAECIPVFLDHPVLTVGPAPPFDPVNPSARAIRYFLRPDPVCSLMRFFNPLLCSPWLMDVVVPCEDPGLLCAAGVLGAPISLLSLNSSVKLGDALREYLNTHPSIYLAGYLASNESDPTKFVAAFLHQ